MSTELEQQGAAVPALAYDPANEITAEDVALPRVKLGQFMSEHVQEERVGFGDVFTELGPEDADPVVLAKAGDKGVARDKAVTFYVLGLRKGKSWTEDGELQTAAFDAADVPDNAWTTYTYFVAIPDADEDLPYKLLLTRTSTPAAKQINMILAKRAALGPTHTVAFELSTAKRSNDKGKFAIAQVRQADEPKTAPQRKAREKQVAVAEKLLAIVNSSSQANGAAQPAAAAGDEPAI